MATDLNEDDIIQVLKVINESNFDELCLETGDLKLVLRKSGCASAIQDPRNVNLVRVQRDAANPAASGEKALLEDHEKDPAVTTLAAPLEEGLMPVKAPVMGIFYRTPRPGASPFVEVGTSVKENDTVCIIEVMKVFHSVSAAVRGVVVKLCAEHGQMVEFGQTLLLIRPNEDQEGKSQE